MKDTTYREHKIKSLITEMESNFLTDVKISPKNFFSQSKTNTVINLYTHSKFEDITPQEAEERGIVFFNKINQALRVATRKTNLDEKSITLLIKDKITYYLANASNQEFMDDKEFGKILNDLVRSYYKYGTVVMRVVPENKRVELVDFNSVIWDQNNYNSAPIIIKKHVSLEDVLRNPLYNTAEIKEYIDEKEIPITPLSKIVAYEMDGYLDGFYTTGNPQDFSKYWQKHILVKLDGQEFLVYSGKMKRKELFVLQREPVDNRSMGLGLVEEMIQSQRQTNEAINLYLEDLRTTTKQVFQTTDDGLDGLDLSELSNFTVVKTARDTEIKQFPKQQSNFMAIQNYMSTWVGQGKEQSNAVDSALGKGEGTREAVGVRGYKLQEIADTFGYETEQIALFLRHLYKERILEIVHSYFNSNKTIEELLLPEQLKSFKAFVAKKLSGAFTSEEILNGNNNITQQEVEKSIIDNFDVIEYDDMVVDKKDFIDKTRVNIVNEQVNTAMKLDNLKLLAQQVMTSPDAYPNAGEMIRDITEEIAMLSDSETVIELYKEAQQMPKNQLVENNNNINGGIK